VFFSLLIGVAFEGTSVDDAFVSLPFSEEVALGASMFGVACGWETKVAVTLQEKEYDNSLQEVSA
jgi:hypothetical protein